MTNENRTRPIQMLFRVTEHERDVIYKRMKHAKTNKRSAFLRKMACDGLILNVDYSQIKELCDLVGNVVSGINQIAKRVNTSQHVYADDIVDIKQRQEKIYAIVNSMHDKLL